MLWSDHQSKVTSADANTGRSKMPITIVKPLDLDAEIQHFAAVGVS